MRCFLRAVVVSLAAALPNAASGQTLEDLDTLSDAVWSVSLAPWSNMKTFADAMPDTLPEMVFEDQSALVLPKEWAGLADQYAGKMERYSSLDQIECLALNAGGIARVKGIVKQHGDAAWDHLPRPVKVFLNEDVLGAIQHDTVVARVCVGVWHPKRDTVDFAAWTQWYDQLETQFGEVELTVSRSASTASAYPAGFLLAKGRACEEGACVVLASPWGVAVPSGNTHQTALTVYAVH